MKKILISACLVGDKVRYDGKGCYNPLIKELLNYFELVPFCPEVEGGLKIPRKRSERRRNEVKDIDHNDVTDKFNLGADKALNLCKYLNIKTAILKDESPSCGVKEIYNGLFQNRKVPGVGWTTEVLLRNKIRVISDKDIEEFINEYKSNKFDPTKKSDIKSPFKEIKK